MFKFLSMFFPLQHWYGIVNPETEDDYSEKLQVTFSANQEFPADHNNLNNFYCQVSLSLAPFHYLKLLSASPRKSKNWKNYQEQNQRNERLFDQSTVFETFVFVKLD